MRSSPSIASTARFGNAASWVMTAELAPDAREGKPATGIPVRHTAYEGRIWFDVRTVKRAANRVRAYLDDTLNGVP
jgi:hypothetical protein